MTIQNFENFHKLANFYETRYQGVFWADEYQIMI